MKNSQTYHSYGNFQILSFLLPQMVHQESKTYSFIGDHPEKNEFSHCHKTSSSSLIKMIGHKRLLNSMQNFKQKDTCKNHSQNSIGEDRFIPNRKLLEQSYKLSLNKQNAQQQDLHDPQCLSIAEIYNESVLASKQVQPQEIYFYCNQNILKYKNHQKKSLNYDKKHKILCSPVTALRKVNKAPSKVLDAPALQDDFYLNLIDWSNDNQIAVGLGNCIYLWNATNSKVTKLSQLTGDIVTSVICAPKQKSIAIGCKTGFVQIWDIEKQKMMRKLKGHQMRVGSMAWNHKYLATGSRDKSILQRDLRMSLDYCTKMQQHTQEICGLKWSFDQKYLASGGNDNKVIVWSQGGQIINKFSDHKAAVKAVAWSPHQHGVLATGGGTADRMIKVRNVFSGSILCQRDAGSQICNLAFSKSLNEIVSTHGYSQNEINLWSYPNMKKVATLIGHSQRVLYLATSPDGSTIVTGAGDQTLRFWNVFPPIHTQKSQKDKKLVGQISLR